MATRFLLVSVVGLAVAHAANSAHSAELRRSKACRIDGMSVVRGQVVFGADLSWFEPEEASNVFQLASRGATQLIGIGDGPLVKNLAARSDGTLYLTEGTDRDADWAYLGHVGGIDEWMMSIVHNECTIEWQKRMLGQNLKGVYLVPSKEPVVLLDKDGVERRVFPAMLARGERRRYLVTTVEPSKYSPSLAANDSYGLGNLCVVQGEVFFALGKLPPGNFSPDDSADLWILDGRLIAIWMKEQWKFLSTDKDGFAVLLDKPKAGSLWDVNPPQKETREGSIRKEQDDGTSLSLAPTGDPVLRTDRNGNDIQFRRAKLQKEPHKVRITRIAR